MRAYKRSEEHEQSVPAYDREEKEFMYMVSEEFRVNFLPSIIYMYI